MSIRSLPMRLRRLGVVGAAGAAAIGLIAPAVAGASPSAKIPVVIKSAQAITALNDQVAKGTLQRNHGSVNRCAALGYGCKYRLVTTAKGSKLALTAKAPVGWGATGLEKAFGLTHSPNGTGRVVVVGFGAFPTLESDLATYRNQYHLPPCLTATGCLKIQRYDGGPPLLPSDPQAEENIGVETALDVEMVSASCPSCTITYLGIPLDSTDQQAAYRMGIAAQTAKRQGAAAVTISYGLPANKTTDFGTPAQMMTTKGMQIFSAAGDYGYMDPETFQSPIGGFPQNLRTVVSAGGTTMTYGPNGSYVMKAWSGAGSGCSPDLGPAAGQWAVIANQCHQHRAVSDVSAVADNLAVYDTYFPYSGYSGGWIVVGGTSASSPFLAGMAGRSPRLASVLGPNVFYGAPRWAYTDVKTGSNGTPAQCSADHVGAALCKSGSGWDGATGLGTPAGLQPFTHSTVT
ncbi:MAG: hypothetical protein ACR2F6_04730 [Mycobacteriales bacterium]